MKRQYLSLEDPTFIMNQIGQQLLIPETTFLWNLVLTLGYPACGIFEVNNKKIVAVTGGEVGPDENGSSTELWDPNSEDGWILGNFYCSKSKKILWYYFINSGPDLPLTSCIYGSVVTSPDGKGILLMGCTIDQNGIYELAENSDGDLEWTKLNQQLESPRYGPIVMSIPNNMTLCQRRNELPN